jgi:AraC family transcriptional regulator, alkane utilization regulator
MTAPWGVTFSPIPPPEWRRRMDLWGLAPPPHDLPAIRGALIALIHGDCWLEVEEHDLKMPLFSGDFVLLTRSSPFTVRDCLQTVPKHFGDLIRREHIEHRLGLRCDGGGAPADFLCGGFCFEDEEDASLLAALPPAIRIQGEQSHAATWLKDTLKFMMQELASPEPGARSVINHLAHVLFIQAVRAHCAGGIGDDTGRWVRAMLDPDLTPALSLMHMHPEEPWTVASLARQTGLSRSTFADKFAAAVGQPPMHYLLGCRMRKARDLLRDGRLGVKAVAAKAGYATESAFSIAFKRIVGVAPGIYRKAVERVSDRESPGLSRVGPVSP